MILVKLAELTTIASRGKIGRLLKIVEERRGHSIIATSEFPIDHFHEELCDRTIADATLDCLLERANPFAPAGVSRRRNDAAPHSITPAV
jgi:hypothetical protein